MAVEVPYGLWMEAEDNGEQFDFLEEIYCGDNKHNLDCTTLALDEEQQDDSLDIEWEVVEEFPKPDGTAVFLSRFTTDELRAELDRRGEAPPGAAP
jgi:hypothetical protein